MTLALVYDCLKFLYLSQGQNIPLNISVDAHCVLRLWKISQDLLVYLVQFCIKDLTF